MLHIKRREEERRGGQKRKERGKRGWKWGEEGRGEGDVRTHTEKEQAWGINCFQGVRNH